MKESNPELVYACRECGNVYNGDDVLNERIDSCRQCKSTNGFIGRLIPLKDPLAKDKPERSDSGLEKVKLLDRVTVGIEMQINSWLEENHGLVKVLDIQLVSRGNSTFVALIRYTEIKDSQKLK
jgi:hypothetical protein